MDKKVRKFLEKDNFRVAVLKDADGTRKAYFGKRAKHEEVKRFTIAYNANGKEGFRRIFRHVREEEPFALAFNEKGKVVLFDGENCVTGGFKEENSQFLILIATENVVVMLVYDAKNMRYPSVLFAESEAQRDSYIRLYFKLQKLGFCMMKYPSDMEQEVYETTSDVDKENENHDEKEKNLLDEKSE